MNKNEFINWYKHYFFGRDNKENISFVEELKMAIVIFVKRTRSQCQIQRNYIPLCATSFKNEGHGSTEETIEKTLEWDQCEIR